MGRLYLSANMLINFFIHNLSAILENIVIFVLLLCLFEPGNIASIQ